MHEFICGMLIECAVDTYISDCIFKLIEREVQEIGMTRGGQGGCLKGEKSGIAMG